VLINFCAIVAGLHPLLLIPGVSVRPSFVQRKTPFPLDDLPGSALILFKRSANFLL
jgi:hypothetical protein